MGKMTSHFLSDEDKALLVQLLWVGDGFKNSWVGWRCPSESILVH